MNYTLYTIHYIEYTIHYPKSCVYSYKVYTIHYIEYTIHYTLYSLVRGPARPKFSKVFNDLHGRTTFGLNPGGPEAATPPTISIV